MRSRWLSGLVCVLAVCVMAFGLGSTGAFCGHDPLEDRAESSCSVCDVHGADAWLGPERPVATPEAVQAAQRPPPPVMPEVAHAAPVSARAPPVTR